MVKQCKNCGTTLEPEYLYCPCCGKKKELTRSDFFIVKRRKEREFKERCATEKGVPQNVSNALSEACWEYADWKYGNLRQFGGRDQHEEIPDEALSLLAQVRSKAAELYYLVLDFAASDVTTF